MLFRGILLAVLGLLGPPLMAADLPGMTPVQLTYELVAQMSVNDYVIEFEAASPGPVDTDPGIAAAAMLLAMERSESRYLKRLSEGVVEVTSIDKIVETGLDPPSI